MPDGSGLLRSAKRRTSHRVERCPNPPGNKQSLRSNSVFKMFSTITLLCFGAFSTAFAQSSQPVRAKVPFPFVAQNMTLPSGNYQLTYNNTGHLLKIRGLDQNSKGAYVTAAPMEATGWASGPGKLLFHCYGQTCYLARVWQGSVSAGRALEVHQTEHERVLGFATRLVSVTIPAK